MSFLICIFYKIFLGYVIVMNISNKEYKNSSWQRSLPWDIQCKELADI